MPRIIAPSIAAFVVFIITSVLIGCLDRPISPVPITQHKQENHDIPFDVNRSVDILFVVDNSHSMGEEQASLAANFPRFIEALEQLAGGLPNVHIGVVSTDMGNGNGNPFCTANGDNGALQYIRRDGCSLDDDFLNGTFIRDVLSASSNGRDRNYQGALQEVFSCIARLGTQGCGFEQPLEAMRQALKPGANPGFLREDAFLAVIFITDEDDCSARDPALFTQAEIGTTDPLGPMDSFRCFEYGVTCAPDRPRSLGEKANCVPREQSNFMYDVDEYVTFLKGLKRDPAQVIVAGIIGYSAPIVVEHRVNPLGPDGWGLAPTCPYGKVEATPPVRLQYFLDQFRPQSTFTPICEQNLQEALIAIGDSVAKVIGSTCFSSNVDLDLVAPGVQANCEISEAQYTDNALVAEVEIPQCSSAAPAPAELPCWYIQENADTCQTAPFQEFVVKRDEVTAPPGTRVLVNCISE